ncbi:MAG: sigma-E factor regulatory protein RseB domain-containing protein [Candidatus Ancaeobacter aquaticus]|nr:sigma-E factor regulatory protein RseB domain-containing protein [Candidatus Ancaeobacter aquaticus]
MKRILVCMSVIGLCVCVSSCAQKTDVDPQSVIKKMMAQESQLDYSGTKVVTQHIKGLPFSVTLDILREHPDKLRFTFIDPPEMNGKECIKIGDNFWRIKDDRPHHRKHFKFHRIFKNFQIRNLNLLLKNFSLRYIGTENVAGRPCYVISVTPKSRSPLWRKLWIDKKHYLTLRSDEFYKTWGRSKPLSIFTFTKINYAPTFKKDTFTVPIDEGAKSIITESSRENVTLKQASRRINVPIYLPTHIPRGYERDELQIYQRDKKEFLHVLYSNGLSTISLFQGKMTGHHKKWLKQLKGKQPQDGVTYRMKKGMLTILNKKEGPTNITLMGKIPTSKLEKMFSSLKKVEK